MERISISILEINTGAEIITEVCEASKFYNKFIEIYNNKSKKYTNAMKIQGLPYSFQVKVKEIHTTKYFLNNYKIKIFVFNNLDEYRSLIDNFFIDGILLKNM